MDRLRRSRDRVRRSILRKITTINEELVQRVINNPYIKRFLETIEEDIEELQTKDQEICDELMDDGSTDDEIDQEMVSIEEFKNEVGEAKYRANEVLNQRLVASLSIRDDDDDFQTASTVGTQKNYKLPKIELKKFDGNLKNWIGFWAQFQKIHEDPQLHESDKFQYLAQSMVEGSRAHQVLSSYPQSAANYPKVVQALTDRFGDKGLLTDVYVRELLNVVSSHQSKKDGVSLSKMYDDLESHLRSLESLGVTSQQTGARLLYPLVESSLPVDLLKIWQRHPDSGCDEDEPRPAEERLKSLMKFLKKEVKGSERLQIAKAEMQDEAKDTPSKARPMPPRKSKMPTAAGLYAGESSKCIFCEKAHDSQVCIKAQTMKLEDKRACIQKKRACFVCLRPGHGSKQCKAPTRCFGCGQKHQTIMCPQMGKPTDPSPPVKDETPKQDVKPSATTMACSSQVILKTLMVDIEGQSGWKRVRALLDDGSQRSYILRRHGAHRTSHNQYEVKIRHVNGPESCTFLGLDQSKICGSIPRLAAGIWLRELKSNGIWINDVGKPGPEISLLLGADMLGKLMTGRINQISNGLTAMETTMGWTLMGQVNGRDKVDSSLALMVLNMSVMDSSIEQLWRLDTIGIRDVADHQSKIEVEQAVRQHFLQTVYRDQDGRYGVSLPWVDGVQAIPSNRAVAEKRLHNMTKKLVSSGNYSAYDDIFKAWIQEGIIEEVKEDSSDALVHYLPHRAVIKMESATTPVRPVFDASCKTGRSPSLNDCLEKGPNLLELIPSILLRFRVGKIGVVSDIRKAFLMIEVLEKDRDFLRFLWWENQDQQHLKVYRHRRVVFGVNCSPYLLGAVIDHHLKNQPDQMKSIANKLLRSMYVDNCVTSVETSDEYDEFKSKTTAIMADAKMELRLWKKNDPLQVSGIGQTIGAGCGLDASSGEEGSHLASVLGLAWDLVKDTLSVAMIEDLNIPSPITKRNILSTAQRIFDPIGFLCPALLLPKLLLQEAWAQKTGWDQQVPEEMQLAFLQWGKQLNQLKKIQIPRNMTALVSSRGNWQIHVFCDASKLAYAAAVFLRTEQHGYVSVQLVQAKSRVAPIKKVSIPRLELLGCLIGARLANSTRTALEMTEVPIYYWTDSTTALAWIKRNNEWGTFVGNRVKEICTITDPDDWFHVPGNMNPADLPSRGCSPDELLRSEWWEGPDWLKQDKESWPSTIPDPDEEEVRREKKKSILVATVATKVETEWKSFSSYSSNVRLLGWILRFISRSRKVETPKGQLTVPEIQIAERYLLRMIQSEVFPPDVAVINGIRVMKDDFGMLGVKTKLSYRHDTLGFRYPVMLPHSHPIVDQLIHEVHERNRHARIQFLMGTLREEYWIIQGRKAIRRVLAKCYLCKLFTSRRLEVEPAPLPEDRVKTARVFEVVGVDLAGPLFLKNGGKSWIVLFTCAVYRCIHLELVKSLSTESFLEALTRFISRRGRPSVIYSDNGTNFVGAENAFKSLNWGKITEQCAIRRIQWKFNPPSAAWWGGFWERLVRSVKELLRRILGRSTVTYDKLHTYLCEVEACINGRPLTTVTKDPDDLVPLTPAMFLHEIPCSSFIELDFFKGAGYQEAYSHRKSVLDDFKRRFRSEYLSQLVQRGKEQFQTIKVGDVVLIGGDNKKRWEWPIAKVVELYPGKDGHVRVAKLRTATGFLDRPLQRLYPLEVSTGDIPQKLPADVIQVKDRGDAVEPAVAETKEIRTKYGRLVKAPVRFGQ